VRPRHSGAATSQGIAAERTCSCLFAQMSLLNCLCAAIPAQERVITCEEVFELSGSWPSVPTCSSAASAPGPVPKALVAASAPGRCSPTCCGRPRSSPVARAHGGGAGAHVPPTEPTTSGDVQWVTTAPSTPLPISATSAYPRSVLLATTISDQQLAGIEAARNGGDLELLLDLHVALAGAAAMDYPASDAPDWIRVRGPIWAAHAERLGALVTVPLLVPLPLGDPLSLRAQAGRRLQSAVRALADGRAEDAVRDARLALDLYDRLDPPAAYDNQGTCGNATWRNGSPHCATRCTHSPAAPTTTTPSPPTFATAVRTPPQSDRKSSPTATATSGSGPGRRGIARRTCEVPDQRPRYSLAAPPPEPPICSGRLRSAGRSEPPRQCLRG
jgi:hypothetical protein